MKQLPLPLIILFVFLIFVDWRSDWRLTSSLYWSVAGLDGNDTAYDFLSAPVEKRVRFRMTMCNDGVCLAHSDWRCGFTIDSSNFDREKYVDWEDAFYDCFSKLVRVVPVYTSLDKVRKICGRHYMQFDPVQKMQTREECEATGGTWGVAKPIYSDEETLLQEAGIGK